MIAMADSGNKSKGSLSNGSTTGWSFAGRPISKRPQIMLLLLALSLMPTLAFAASGAAAPAQDAEPAPANASLNRSLAAFPDSLLTINDSNIDSMQKQYSPLFIDFWEPRCYPCVLMNETMEEMAKDLKGRAAFGMLNIYDNPASMEKYRITRTPTLILFENGTIIYIFIGYADKSMMSDKISAYL